MICFDLHVAARVLRCLVIHPFVGTTESADSGDLSVSKKSFSSTRVTDYPPTPRTPLRKLFYRRVSWFSFVPSWESILNEQDPLVDTHSNTHSTGRTVLKWLFGKFFYPPQEVVSLGTEQSHPVGGSFQTLRERSLRRRRKKVHSFALTHIASGQALPLASHHTIPSPSHTYATHTIQEFALLEKHSSGSQWAVEGKAKEA